MQLSSRSILVCQRSSSVDWEGKGFGLVPPVAPEETRQPLQKDKVPRWSVDSLVKSAETLTKSWELNEEYSRIELLDYDTAVTRDTHESEDWWFITDLDFEESFNIFEEMMEKENPIELYVHMAKSMLTVTESVVQLRNFVMFILNKAVDDGDDHLYLMIVAMGAACDKYEMLIDELLENPFVATSAIHNMEKIVYYDAKDVDKNDVKNIIHYTLLHCDKQTCKAVITYMIESSSDNKAKSMIDNCLKHFFNIGDLKRKGHI